jgi:hypothetical protein
MVLDILAQPMSCTGFERLAFERRMFQTGRTVIRHCRPVRRSLMSCDTFRFPAIRFNKLSRMVKTSLRAASVVQSEVPDLTVTQSRPFVERRSRRPI